jgi:hypothetical protein
MLLNDRQSGAWLKEDLSVMGTVARISNINKKTNKNVSFGYSFTIFFEKVDKVLSELVWTFNI